MQLLIILREVKKLRIGILISAFIIILGELRIIL
jgi:uncharacterized membrane protein